MHYNRDIKAGCVDTRSGSRSIPQKKILIADDDVTNRLVLEGILRYQGYETLQAENGKQVIEIFHQDQPDLILLDVMMPEMDGYQTAQEIKRLSEGQFLPIIFLTAVTDEVALAKCIEYGGDDFLTKPYNHIILKARMDALFRIREMYNTIDAQNREIKVYQQRMQQEAMMAEILFANIIKSNALEKSYIKYLLSPMSLFNGDVLIAADKPSGGLNILLGDFTGHGMAAATGALPASSVFYGMTNKGFSIAEIAAEINLKMKSILPTGIFFAACLVDLNPVTRSVSIWNGGIPDVLIFSNNSEQPIQRIKSSHLPMGILDGSSFDNHVETLSLSDGDRIYIYSDGVIETASPTNVMFGQQRLEQALSADIPNNTLFEHVERSLDAFRGNQEQKDDITFIEIRYDTSKLDDVAALKSFSSKAQHPASHWDLSFVLEADLLRNADPLPVVVQSITEIQGLKSCRQQLYTIMAELYSNALEHGLLGLDSSLKSTPEGFLMYYQQRELQLAQLSEGYIRIGVSHVSTETGGQLLIRVEDSGPGFDYRTHNSTLEENVGHSGRGVPLIHSMCESVQYQGSGNIVEAVFAW